MNRGPLLALPLLAAACGPAAPQPERAPPAVPFPPPTPLGLDVYLPTPPDNPLNPAKVALGRSLFQDPLLSGDGSLACASCHRPGVAFADSLPVSPGVHGRLGSRNAPTLVNRGYGRAFFWDGRARTLEQAVLQPIANPKELDLPLDSLAARLRRHPTYPAAFELAFGGEEAPGAIPPDPARAAGRGGTAGDPGDDVVTSKNIARALASFLRTLRSGDAPLDCFLAGDTAALSPQARRGRQLFLGKAGCAACHAGPNLTDEGFHNTGVGWPQDPGRFTVTGLPKDSGRFKTPTLREVARTGPYMHDGSVPSLDSVVAFYAGGGVKNLYLDDDIRPVELNAGERRELVAFLEALTGCGSQVRRSCSHSTMP